ncbi:phage portal protein [Priestia megaterium]|uniref:phage portal protein n=1 Tax=Priestia megaterium TaxID=1404 RepID=UPI00196AE85D|nr:phage portal protein [Priestia megaterium]QSF38449.1 phage portal protein [Priestia megaterium]
MTSITTRAKNFVSNMFEKREFNAETVQALTQSALVTEDAIMNIPTVTACIDIITGAMTQMPIYLYRESDNGAMKRIADYRTRLLNDQSAPNMNALNTRKQMIKDYLLEGEVYVRMYKQTNVIPQGNITVYGDFEKLVHIPAKNVTVTQYNDGEDIVKADFMLTTIEGNNIFFNKNRTKKLNEADLLRILNNSLTPYQGVGVLKRGKTILEQALGEMDYTSNIYKNGAMPKGILKTSARMNPKAMDKLRESWQLLFGGVKNAHKTVVLEEGMEYQALSLNPDQIQMIETKKGTISEICKLFGVPESMVTTSANKYGSIEQNQINFLKQTLGTIITDFESAYNQYLLTEEEKANGYQFRFDTSELLRATEKEKTEAVALGLEKGLLTINEARFKLDLPPLDEDLFMWGLQTVLYNPKTGEMKVPNMGLTGAQNQQKGNDVNNE